MTFKICKVGLCLFITTVLLGTSLVAWASTQEKVETQIAGVDNSKMGTYCALAELSFRAFQRGDVATASELGRILERTWDKIEEGGGAQPLQISNPDLFRQLDQAMDDFVQPLINSTLPRDNAAWLPAPNPAKVEVAYNTYLEKLKHAESQSVASCTAPNSTRIAIYEYLALLTYTVFQHGDLAGAKQGADAIEFTFNQTSGCLVRRGVDRQEEEKLITSFNEFITPLQKNANDNLDPVKIGEAYRHLSDELKKVE
jgi:hypothetical protein